MKNMMKTSGAIILLAALLFSSCRKDVRPYANFAVNHLSVYPYETVIFTNNSIDAISYEWEFGDGSSSTAISPTHSYEIPGTYTVQLTARSVDGLTDAVTKRIEVLSVTADFAVNYSLVQPYEWVEFTNYSAGASSYLWNFGDGTTSTATHPDHQYVEEGIYKVTLTATGNGYSDQVSMDIEVKYTLLDITVQEWGTDYIVPGALVVLYETLDDWDRDENAVVWGNTDANGVISFAGLWDRQYYVWASAENVAVNGDRYDNLDFYLDGDYSYLRTPVLELFTQNYWTCWVDYFLPAANRDVSRAEKYANQQFKRDGKVIIAKDIKRVKEIDDEEEEVK